MKAGAKIVLKYLGIYELSILAGLLFYVWAQYPAQLAFKMSEMTEQFVRAALGLTASTVGLFFLSYKRKGLKNKSFCFRDALLKVLLAFAIVQVVAFIFQYVIYIAGTATDLSRGIWMMAGHDFNREDVPKWVTHLCMLSYDILLFIPATLLGEYLGTKKSIKMREELLGNREEGA